MNFLQLAQKLRQECGVAGTGPLSVTGQVNEAKRLVDYINDAWVEIQGLHDTWGFMREDFSFPLVPATGDYTPTAAGLTDWKRWHTDTLRAYRTADGIADEQWLVEWDYQIFRDTYRYSTQTPGRPVVFAVRPKDKALMFGPVPETNYTVVGEYQKLPSQMVLATDTPPIPEPLHIVIVYKAMQYYGLYESAGEVLARGERGYRQYITMLERQELPDLVLGEPLA
jgi:hypothetical protein